MILQCGMMNNGKKQRTKSLEDSVYKNRKNFQSRQRSCIVRGKLDEIRLKPPGHRTVEDAEAMERHEKCRLRKNERSRKRLNEHKAEIDRIVQKSGM
mmetsp:Transcript_12859/g.21341  ORF Transcript_12859/g.21341 Transcript_12859/m.21341 type:complete len:97 (+) Transcript_12859:133-423(+)